MSTPQDEVYNRESSSMSSLFSPVDSPHSPPLATSSPEIYSESDFPRPLHLPSARPALTPSPPSPDSSLSSPAPDHTQSPIASASASASASVSASAIHSRPDLVPTSASVSRSRSSSLRNVYPSATQSITPPHLPMIDGTAQPHDPPIVNAAPVPSRKQSNGHVPEAYFQARSPGAHGPARRNSQDRRVRSEGLIPKSSPMAHGKSPSLVTGGYATTDSDSLSDKEHEDGFKARPSSSRATTSFFSTRSTQLLHQERRRRAQSLMIPMADDHSPSGEGSGSARSFGSSRPGNRRPDDIALLVNTRERQRSQSTSIISPLATSRSSQLRPNGNPPRSPLASHSTSRVPSAHFADPPSSSNRRSSHRLSKETHQRNTSQSPPQRTSELPARSREVDRLRREEGVSSPEGSRKGKEKAHDSPPTKRHGLASSLLNAPLSESPSLTPGTSNQITVE